jgi:hypothetical protein
LYCSILSFEFHFLWFVATATLDWICRISLCFLQYFWQPCQFDQKINSCVFSVSILFCSDCCLLSCTAFPSVSVTTHWFFYFLLYFFHYKILLPAIN